MNNIIICIYIYIEEARARFLFSIFSQALLICSGAVQAELGRSAAGEVDGMILLPPRAQAAGE